MQLTCAFLLAVAHCVTSRAAQSGYACHPNTLYVQAVARFSHSNGRYFIDLITKSKKLAGRAQFEVH